MVVVGTWWGWLWGLGLTQGAEHIIRFLFFFAAPKPLSPTNNAVSVPNFEFLVPSHNLQAAGDHNCGATAQKNPEIYATATAVRH